MMSRDAVVCPNDLKFETRVATIILSSCGKFESQRTSIHETSIVYYKLWTLCTVLPQLSYTGIEIK